MKYRRFGKTELQMPVLSCGGMRFQQTWNADFSENPDKAGQKNLEDIIHKAVANGINHIETARGYGSSEYQLGFVLPSLPRDEIIVQTKIGPKDSEDDFLRTFETSLKNLQLDYVDLLAIHGINTDALLSKTLNKGTISACRKLQTEGLARHIGFSSHGLSDLVCAAVNTGKFDFVNLHWYYFDQYNHSAIEAAQEHDMGVFIISPSDKGGKLYAPPRKLMDICQPFHPMVFNELFCLSHPGVHTVSIGASRPSDFDLHLEMLNHLDNATELIAPIMKQLKKEFVESMGAEWALHWQENLPAMVYIPEEIPLYHILRMLNMAKAYDMIEYGKMRYNLLGSGGHWFPGVKARETINLKSLPGILKEYQFSDRIPGLLREAHAMFNAEDVKRESES